MTLIPLDQRQESPAPSKISLTLETPKTGTLTEMDSDMQKIINDNSLDDRTKWTLYQQLLQRFNNLKEHDEGGNFEKRKDETWIQAFPIKYRGQARKIFDHLRKAQTRVRWSNEGIVSLDGHRIENSDITQLVYHSISPLKEEPTGWSKILPFIANSLPVTPPTTSNVVIASPTPIKKRLRNFNKISGSPKISKPSKPIKRLLTKNKTSVLKKKNSGWIAYN